MVFQSLRIARKKRRMTSDLRVGTYGNPNAELKVMAINCVHQLIFHYPEHRLSPIELSSCQLSLDYSMKRKTILSREDLDIDSARDGASSLHTELHPSHQTDRVRTTTQISVISGRNR